MQIVTRDFKIGDRVKVVLYDGAHIGYIVKTSKNTVTLDISDDAGRMLTVYKSCAILVPSVFDVGNAAAELVH